LGKVNPAAQADFNLRYQERFLVPLAALFEAGVRPVRSALSIHTYVFGRCWGNVPFFNSNFVGQPAEVDKVVGLIETIFFEGLAYQK